MRKPTTPRLVPVTVEMTVQQKQYLDSISAECRAKPADMLLALAFGMIESDKDEVGLEHWVACLRGFVDERRVPTFKPSDVNGYESGGEIPEDLPPVCRRN